jgi:hypothetical protein
MSENESIKLHSNNNNLNHISHSSSKADSINRQNNAGININN